MEMKINRFTLIAISLALLAGSACSGKKPSASVPAVQKTPPPPIQASKPSKPATSASVTAAKESTAAIKSDASVPVQVEPKPAPPADPVADLIAKVEKEYQAGQQEY